MFIFNLQRSFTTIFLPDPHNNPRITHDWCHHPRSTDKAGRNADFARSHSQSRIFQVSASQCSPFPELRKQLFREKGKQVA